MRENRLLPPDALWLPPADTLARLAAIPAAPYQEHATAIAFNGDARVREQQWQTQIDQGGDLTLHFPSEGSREQWQERLGARGLALHYTVSPNRHSFRDGDAVHLAEADLHTTPVAPNYRQNRSRDPAALIRSLQDLSPGTAVVHADFGVGRYLGLEKLEDDGDELIAIAYAKGAKLYVPTADIDLITRYGGSDPDSAPLHELGGKSWQTARRKIRASLHDTAAELLALYAKREATAGITIAHDPAAQAALAAEFPFATTPDQQTAIDAVLADLARPQPMDRIICGDVGFGKTEVAVRAIHAAASAGYQVALIAPTTLLAEQHYHNLQDRFANHPLTIDSLSRFKSAADAKRAVERLKAGGTDLIIGTHRLLQKDIAFKNLGLVIIDEEQRFGVRHKEKLKSLRSDTNLLTLTATPIPRTLAMSHYGELDCSIIDALPAGRQPIQTSVVSNQKRDAVIARVGENCRAGRQAYWVCPLIEESDTLECENAEATAAQLQMMLPDIRVALLHGRMTNEQRQATMSAFVAGEAQLLVATTVIEVGVDVANATLMIIENAERFGLAQLHQLRGRVGRGSAQSYCLLMYQPPLGETAQRRLRIMRETTDGFRIAEEDLAIRGAGELLGTRQTGEASFRVARLPRDGDLLAETERLTRTLRAEHPDYCAVLLARWTASREKYLNA